MVELRGGDREGWVTEQVKQLLKSLLSEFTAPDVLTYAV